jgi:hypothetical protein
MPPIKKFEKFLKILDQLNDQTYITLNKLKNQEKKKFLSLLKSKLYKEEYLNKLSLVKLRKLIRH